jgi:hypothetical protein
VSGRIYSIEQQIETAYRQDIEASVSAMRQAQQLSTQGEQRITATNQYLEEVLLFWAIPILLSSLSNKSSGLSQY